ncbi:MAG: glutaredoxin family protein [Methanomicrobiales archaeon]|nr:glutaredoxin family protein [Methanomicrobiales archaeon]
MATEHVDGKDKGNVVLYALSTCGWCGKTKELLRQMGIAFDFVYVDLLEGSEQDDAITQVEKYNPAGSFPTLVINNRKVIVGFREQEIREALGS